jgi:hypothetical protein
MRSLTKLDSKFIGKLESHKIINLEAITGGAVEVTCGVTYIMCGKTFEARDYKDKINYHIDKKKGIVYDGLPYDYELLKPLNNADVPDGYSDILNTYSM